MTSRGTRLGPLRVALAYESELVTRGLAAMLAPYDEIMLVPVSPGEGLATFVDITLHDTFEVQPDARRDLEAGGHPHLEGQ